MRASRDLPCTHLVPRKATHAAAFVAAAAGLGGTMALAGALLPPPLGLLMASVLATGGVAVATNLLTGMPGPASPWLHARRRVTARVGPEGLCLGDAPPLPRERLAQGWSIPRPGGAAEVVLTRADRPAVHLEMETEKDAAALLHALGLDASRASLTLPIAWPHETTPAGLLLVAAFFALGAVLEVLADMAHAPWMSTAGSAAWLVMAAAPALARLLGAPCLVIGRDGVSRSLGRRVEGVSYAQILEVEPARGPHLPEEEAEEEGLAFTLRDGRRIEWMLDTSEGPSPGLATRVALDRIRTAMVARARDTGRDVLVAPGEGSPPREEGWELSGALARVSVSKM